MRASILAVGDELLGTDRLDTNSLALTEVLRRRGVDLVSKAVVGDDVVEIAETLDALRERAELLLVTGGLGPTRDDLTREGLARLLGRSVAVDEELWTRIERGFRKLGRRIPRVNRKQAERVEGAEMLPNRAGVAPGQRIEDPAPVPRGTTYFLFPGVPRELHAIVEDALDPWLAARSEDGAGFDQVEVRVACLPESVVEERIAPVYERFGDGNVSVLARPGEIRLRLRAGGAVEGRPGRLAEMEEAVRDALGDAVFCVGPIEDGIEFEAAVGGLLAARGETVAVAESCTGGLLGQRLTATAGSSAWFVGGLLTYSNGLKMRLLDVPRETLVEHGAVSKPTALAMAAGARVRCGSDYGIGITGVAGPGGGSESRPVGTVHIAVAGPADSRSHFEARFPGDRARVRQLSTQFALEMLRRMLLSGAGPADALPWAAPSRMGPP
ncbi:MAG: CinA family nicotinamide mononucleotide deamidase-related protein [Acidobacteriota bacterium]|nr:CinA family nicotinamide mononucleotide deamidase-related protein [Acidobacteriota bacterium]